MFCNNENMSHLPNYSKTLSLQGSSILKIFKDHKFEACKNKLVQDSFDLKDIFMVRKRDPRLQLHLSLPPTRYLILLATLALGRQGLLRISHHKKNLKILFRRLLKLSIMSISEL